MKAESKISIWTRIRRSFSQFLDNLDKKIEAKSKAKPCCCKPDKEKNQSCCN